MTLYVLVKSKVFVGSPEDPETDLLCGGSKKDCVDKMREIVEEELLDFDLNDPDTWIEEDTGDGNEGECYTIYRILPLQLECGQNGQLCKPNEDRLRKLEYENERIKEQNMKFATDAVHWETKYRKLEKSLTAIMAEGLKIFKLFERKVRQNAEEKN